MTNIEIKARYQRTRLTDETLVKIGAQFDRIETQTDTYFDVNNGRLKIRVRDSGVPQLIQYFREDSEGPRPSFYELVHLKDVRKVKKTLENEHGIRVIVRKKREIWIWENVRIHFDIIENLGDFIEFEAVIESDMDISMEQKRVEFLIEEFGISKNDLIGQSYGDLLIGSK